MGKGWADAPPKARALYLDRVAWAYTKAGGSENARQAIRALGEAGDALAEENDGRESPPYLYWVNSEELQIMESRVHTELHHPLRAVPQLREVLAGYDVTRAREMALYLSWLAVAYADAGEPEESVAIAERVVSLSAEVASARIADRVQVVTERLRDFADVSGVRSFLDSVGG